MCLFFKRKIKSIENHFDLQLESMRVVNRFLEMGFVSRCAFVEVVTTSLPHRNTQQDRVLLRRFWNGEVYDKFLIKELKYLLDSAITSLPVNNNTYGCSSKCS